MTSKAEYLKRYFSDDSVTKKKKKKQKPVVDSFRVKILDDDVDFKTLLPQNINNTLDDDVGDNTPAVADFVDERPQHVKELERFRQSKQWKLLSQQPDSSSNDRRSSESSTADNSRDLAEASAKHRLAAVVARPHQRHDSDSDLSPVRADSHADCTHHADVDLSPKRAASRSKQRHDSDSDLSPVRADHRHTNEDLSPKRAADRSKQRHDSDSDLSPVRADRHVNLRHSANVDVSPKRAASRSKLRHDSDYDVSPARVTMGESAGFKMAHDGSRRHDSDSDLSPPRTSNIGQRGGSDSDLSPVRRDQNSSRSSHQPAHRQHRCPSPRNSQQRRRRQDSDGDLSPKRRSAPEKNRRKDSDSDLSPPRADRSQKVTTQNEDRPKTGKATKTLSGAQAGLQFAADMRKESQTLRKQENASFAKMSDEMSGKNALTVLRDRATGRRRNLDAERAEQAKTDAAKAVITAKYDVWNKGLRQKELQDERVSDAVHEADKPLARYRDDADLDARLRQREDEEDPMLEYIRRKKNKERGITASKPVYRGPEPPPNRFGIRPGYRWDGVDRSTGFEKQYFTKLSERKAITDMAYKWSVEDM